MSESSILDTANKGTPTRSGGRLYPLGIGLGLVPVALLIAFGFTQCRLVVMCDPHSARAHGALFGLSRTSGKHGHFYG